MKPRASRTRWRFALIGALLAGVAGVALFDRWQTYEIDHMRVEPSPELDKLYREPTNTPLMAQLDPSTPIRLALGPLGLAAPADGQLADLLTAELSRGERFALVERRELDRALQELELGLGGLARAANAVKVGRLVRADWFLLGAPGRIEGTTNAILARIVDARSSILRDVTIFPAHGNLTSLSGEVAAFIQRAAQVTTNGTPRIYLAIGGFEDLSVNDRYTQFPQQLKAYLTTSYQGSTTTLVERELVNALLQEVRLDLAGLTADGATNAPVRMQSAFWLVDGFYQSYEQSGPEIDLVLRVERVLGGRELVSLRGQPEEALFRRAPSGAARNLACRPSPTTSTPS